MVVTIPFVLQVYESWKLVLYFFPALLLLAVSPVLMSPANLINSGSLMKMLNKTIFGTYPHIWLETSFWLNKFLCISILSCIVPTVLDSARQHTYQSAYFLFQILALKGWGGGKEKSQSTAPLLGISVVQINSSLWACQSCWDNISNHLLKLCRVTVDPSS